jgi:cytochrome P450
MTFRLTNLPEGFHDNPYPSYAWLRQQAPVCAQPDGSYVLSRHADLDMIYRDTRRFISDKKKVFAPKFGTGTPLFEHHTTSLVFNDPPLHTRVRKIMVGAMTPRALASLEPGLITLTEALLSEMQDQPEVDLIAAYAGAIPIEVIGNLFNIPRADRAPLRDWSLAILGALEPELTPEQHARGNDAVRDFTSYLADLAADRRAHPGNPETDVLTRLIQSEEGQLTPSELYQNCIFILNAGHETTTNLIGNGAALLDQNPDIRAALIAEPSRIAGAVDEILRLESPNQFGNRLTTEEIELHGTRIPAGTDLHLCIGAANRDAAAFEKPGAITLDRRPNRHHAFAGGAHSCVGLTLAKMEGRIALGKLLERFPNYRIAAGAKRAKRIRFRGFAALPITLNAAQV